MTHRSRLISSLAILLSCIGASFSGAAPTLAIEDRELHALSPLLFGQFLERPSWGGELGPEAVCNDQGQLSPEIEKHLALLHAPVVRFPFGTDGDYVDWTDMIDLPGRDKRPVTIGYKGDKVTNRFGWPEYFLLAEKMHWQTILVVNLRDALYKKKPLAKAARHAAALVAYCGEEPAKSTWARQRVTNGQTHALRIKAVQVGNEGWFFWPPKPEERAALGLADDHACASWLRECLVSYADAIHSVRKDVPLICDAPRPLDGGGLENNAAMEWKEAVNHDTVRARYSMLAAHAYAPMGLWTIKKNGVDTPPASLSEDEIWNANVATLGRFNAQGECLADGVAYDEIRQLGYRVAVTEWNWNGWGFKKKFPQATFDNAMPSALGAAGFLHGMMRHPNVSLATQSMMLGTSWGITSVRVTPQGQTGFLPQGEAVRLIAEHHGDNVLVSHWQDLPKFPAPVQLTTWWPAPPALAQVDAIVTSSRTAYYVHLIHRHRTEPLSINLRLPTAIAGESSMHLLTSEQNATTIKFGLMQRSTQSLKSEENKLSLTMPPASIAVVVIPKTFPTPH